MLSDVVPVPAADVSRPQAVGKFLFVDGRKLEVRGVTYGTFRPGPHGAALPDSCVVHDDFAEYLLFPETARWWLGEFPRLASHIEARFPRVARRTVVRLTDGSAEGSEEGRGRPFPVMEHRTTAPPSLPSASVVIPCCNVLADLVDAVAA